MEKIKALTHETCLTPTTTTTTTKNNAKSTSFSKEGKTGKKQGKT